MSRTRNPYIDDRKAEGVKKALRYALKVLDGEKDSGDIYDIPPPEPMPANIVRVVQTPRFDTSKAKPIDDFMRPAPKPPRGVAGFLPAPAKKFDFTDLAPSGEDKIMGFISPTPVGLSRSAPPESVPLGSAPPKPAKPKPLSNMEAYSIIAQTKGVGHSVTFGDRMFYIDGYPVGRTKADLYWLLEIDQAYVDNIRHGKTPSHTPQPPTPKKSKAATPKTPKKLGRPPKKKSDQPVQISFDGREKGSKIHVTIEKKSSGTDKKRGRPKKQQ